MSPPPQVRFGVLNAGNFGVAQSRKRTFIWAAAPGELLPDWPRLMHCFRTPQLTINLPGGVQYCAVPQTVGASRMQLPIHQVAGSLGGALMAGSRQSLRCRAMEQVLCDAPPACSPAAPLPCPLLQVGAPLRPVTVRDAIADLPTIENGHSVEEMEYVSGPVRAGLNQLGPAVVPSRVGGHRSPPCTGGCLGAGQCLPSTPPPPM